MSQESHDAHISVSGDMAENVANSVLDALGVEADEVGYIDVSLVSENGEQTTINFEADGPKAGHVAADMLPRVDHGGHAPSEIEVALDKREPADGDADGEADEADPFDEDDEEVAENGHDEEIEVEVAPDTNQHLALTAIAAYYSKLLTPGDGDGDSGGQGRGSDGEGVTARELKRVIGVSLDREQLQRALYACANQKGVLSKQNVTTQDGGIRAAYRLTDEGVATLESLGAHDGISESIEPVLDGVPTPDGNSVGASVQLADGPNEARREAGKVKLGDTDRTHEPHEKSRDEPDVDSPQPVTQHTRKHQVLHELTRLTGEVSGREWVTGRELYSLSDIDLSSHKNVCTYLSTLFLENALVERKPAEYDEGSNTHKYRANEAGRAELDRLGTPDGL